MPLGQTERFAAKLRALGVETLVSVEPDEPHVFDQVYTVSYGNQSVFRLTYDAPVGERIVVADFAHDIASPRITLSLDGTTIFSL